MTLLIQGGWVLWVILALSVTAVAIAFQKMAMLRHTAISKHYVDALKNDLNAHSAEAVQHRLQHSHGVVDRVAAVAIQHYQSSDDVIKASLQQATALTVRVMQSKMGVLSVIVTVAPVLGLLGTVLGLMDVFSVLSVEGVADPKLLSNGISKALITTVAGLSLAIPFMFIHPFLMGKINQRLDDWDRITTQLIAHLRG